MNALTAAGWTVRITGLVILLLGLLIWVDVRTGARARSTCSSASSSSSPSGRPPCSALRAGAGPILPAVAVGWGVLTVVFGMNQAPAPASASGHVVVEVAHLLVGIVAIGLGEALVGAGRRGAIATA